MSKKWVRFRIDLLWSPTGEEECCWIQKSHSKLNSVSTKIYKSSAMREKWVTLSLDLFWSHYGEVEPKNYLHIEFNDCETMYIEYQKSKHQERCMRVSAHISKSWKIKLLKKCVILIRIVPKVYFYNLRIWNIRRPLRIPHTVTLRLSRENGEGKIRDVSSFTGFRGSRIRL